MRVFTLALVSSFILQSSGCQARQPEPRSLDCKPSNTPPAPLSAEALAGSYRLRMVATEGIKAGQAAEGTLSLMPYESSLRAVTIDGMRDTAASYVHYGSTDLDLEAVGAVRLGDPGSLDPTRPGALVVERKGAITLRLGSEANRRDVVRFDGGFTALRVSGTSGEGFTGSWSSGAGVQRSSAGYFCAVRTGGRADHKK